MNEIDNDDNERQVFVINDEYCGSDSRLEGTKINHKFSEDASWSVLKFIGVGFVALIVISSFAGTSDSNSGKVQTFFALLAVSVSLFFYFLFNSAKKYKNNLERETSSNSSRYYDMKNSRIRSRNGSNQKKFNTIQEYQAYEESISGNRRSREQDSVTSEAKRLEEQRAENIEIAVRALVSLKFKINRANHLVSLALDSGIPPEDTQMLIRYALSNNNKA